MISGTIYSGIQTRFAQTDESQTEYIVPSIKLLNFYIIFKDPKIIYQLPYSGIVKVLASFYMCEV